MKSKEISAGGIFAGLSLLMLYMTSVVPTASAAFTALAGLMPTFAVLHSGVLTGIMVYLVSIIIGIFLTPVKSYVVMFAVVFGVYPFAKYFIDKVKSKAGRVVLKIAVSNLMIAFLIFVYSKLLFNSMVFAKILDFGIIYMFAFLNVVFWLYEVGITQVFDMYKFRILKISGHGRTL